MTKLKPERMRGAQWRDNLRARQHGFIGAEAQRLKRGAELAIVCQAHCSFFITHCLAASTPSRGRAAPLPYWQYGCKRIAKHRDPQRKKMFVRLIAHSSLLTARGGAAPPRFTSSTARVPPLLGTNHFSIGWPSPSWARHGRLPLFPYFFHYSHY